MSKKPAALLMLTLLFGGILATLSVPLYAAEPPVAGTGTQSVAADSQTLNSDTHTLTCTYHTQDGPVKVTYYQVSFDKCPHIFIKPKSSHDPQYGYLTTASNGAYGINDKEVATNWILTNNIAIGQAFFDNNGNWFHNGIGENTDGSVCTNPPEIWGEYLISGHTMYGEVALVCTKYGDTSQISTVYDSHISEFAWFVNGTERASVSFTGEGSKVGDSSYPQSYDFIETSASSPACPSTSYFVYNHALEYSTSAANNGVLPSFTDPTQFSLSVFNSNWPTTCWGIGRTASPFQIEYLT